MHKIRRVSRIPAHRPPANVGALLKKLRILCYPWRGLTIGIDGRMGVGKSTLARYLAWQLGMPVIETDMWRVSGAIPSARRLRQIEQLARGRRERRRPLIIEGVSLLALSDRIGLEIDYLIWVQNSEVDPTDDDDPDLERLNHRLGVRLSGIFLSTNRTNTQITSFVSPEGRTG